MFSKQNIKSVNDHSSPYDDEVWKNIEKKLNEKRKRKLLLILFLSVAILITTFSVYQSNSKDKTKIETIKESTPTP